MISDAAEACRNFGCASIVSRRCMERKSKTRWHSVITVNETARNIFMNTLVMVHTQTCSTAVRQRSDDIIHFHFAQKPQMNFWLTLVV